MKCLRATVWARRAILAALSLAAFAAAPMRAEPTWAQGGEEAPLGSFNLQPSTDSPRRSESFGGSGVSDGDSGSGPNAWFLPGFDFSVSNSGESTDALFKRAVDAFEAGRSDEAQGLLEKVIAEAPGSPLATKARRYLATLYNRGAGGPVEIDTGAIEGSAAAPAVADVKPVPRTLDPAAILAKGGGTHISPRVEEEFLLEAGDRVFFSAGSAELGVRARTVLQAQARFIVGREAMAAMIEGHADDGMAAGDEQIRLSHARAEAVRDRLVAEGVNPERLLTVARGRAAPVSACSEPSCAAQNRRAITVLLSSEALKTLKSAQVSGNTAPGSARSRPTQ